MSLRRTLTGIVLLTAATMGTITSCTKQGQNEGNLTVKTKESRMPNYSQEDLIKHSLYLEDSSPEQKFRTALAWTKLNDLTDDSRTALAYYFIDTGNPRRAEIVAEGIKDPQERFYIAKGLIDSGNPANAVKLAKGMTDMYWLYDITKELIVSGNSRNAVYLFESIPRDLGFESPSREMWFEYVVKGAEYMKTIWQVTGNRKLKTDLDLLMRYIKDGTKVDNL